MFCETKFHFYPHIILLRPYCRMQFEFSVLVSIINRNCTFTIHSGDSSLLLFFLLLNHESLVVSLALQANISDLYYAVELSCTFLAFGKSRFEMFQCWRPRSFAFLYKIKFSNHVRLIRHGLTVYDWVCVCVCVCLCFLYERTWFRNLNDDNMHIMNRVARSSWCFKYSTIFIPHWAMGVSTFEH